MSDSSDPRALGPLLPPLLTVGAMGLMSEPAQAEEPEALDEEFLDYLLQLEGDDEDWTLFDSQESEAAPPATAARTAPPAKESTTAAKTPAAKQPAAPSTKATSTQTNAPSGSQR